MRALPHYYWVELHNFNPNSIAQATIFSTVYEGFLGIEPHWDLWLHLFRVEPFSLPSKVRKVCHTVHAGGCTLATLGPGRTVHPRHPHLFEQGVAELMVLPPQRRWAAAGVYTPCRPWSGGEVEVGATARSPDPPKATARGAAEALGLWSHRGRGCRGLPPAAGAAAGRPPTLPRRDDH
jgi:hypothetical protein